MELVILVIHIILAASIIGVILLQPPESSSLGGLGGANPMAGVTTRGQGNILTRATAILATAFIVTSLILAIMASRHPHHASILDQAEQQQAVEAVPAAEQATQEVTPDVEPEAPSVPLSK